MSCVYLLFWGQLCPPRQAGARRGAGTSATPPVTTSPSPSWLWSLWSHLLVSWWLWLTAPHVSLLWVSLSLLQTVTDHYWQVCSLHHDQYIIVTVIYWDWLGQYKTLCWLMLCYQETESKHSQCYAFCPCLTEWSVTLAGAHQRLSGAALHWSQWSQSDSLHWQCKIVANYWHTCVCRHCNDNPPLYH